MSWSSTLRAAAAVLLSAAVLPAFAEISTAERNVLKALYSSTNGDDWTDNTGWDVDDDGSVVCPGAPLSPPIAGVTQSPWFGIQCYEDNPTTHRVVTIRLPDNNLSGPLPALGDLTLLRNFIVFSTNGGTSFLTSLPPDLASLTSLRNFSVAGNGPGLEGTLPASFAGFTLLETFRVNHNGLTGSVPSLAGAPALTLFHAHNNALDGVLPANVFGGSGLPALQEFRVNNNQLTGSLPALTGMTALTVFRAEANRLTGNLPNATLNSGVVPALVDYEVHDNGLTGNLPTLTGLTNLLYFSAGGNQLTGTIPSINHLSSLVAYNVRYNRLTGNLPDLTGLNNLLRFRVDGNRLTGPMPPTLPAGMTIFQAGSNQLTGTPPAAPASLLAGQSNLCFNNLSRPFPESAAWNAATGSTPWWRACDTAAPAAVPTLGQWALILLGFLVAGMVALRRGGRA